MNSTSRMTLHPHWPQQPLQPQWPQWPQQPLQPYFLKKLPDPDGLIINDMKMTNTSPFLWNESSKIQIYPNICFLFCRRLLRTEYVTFLKTGWWNSNSPISGIYWYLQTKSNLHISIHQRQFKIYTLPWGTLYFWGPP